MGTTIDFFPSPERALLFIAITSNPARYGIMAYPPNFKISPGIQSGPTNFFFPIADSHVLITLMLMVKVLHYSVD
jgi:hypothetical protein